MAQWQRVGFQIRRLGVRIPLASETRSLFLCAATRSWLPLPCSSVPVAQLDKASDYESEDWGFESLQGYYFCFVFVLILAHIARPVLTVKSACSVMVIIGASQALDPGSIPGRRTAMLWGISSIGRVRALQARGTGIETPMLHSFSLSIIFIFCSLRAVLVAVNISSGSSVGRAWV